MPKKDVVTLRCQLTDNRQQTTDNRQQTLEARVEAKFTLIIPSKEEETKVVRRETKS